MQVYQDEMGVFMGAGRRSKTEAKVSMVAKGKSEAGKTGKIHSNVFPSLR